MAEYRTVRMSFWHDPYIEGLDAKAKLLYLYLFTGPYANNLGIVEATRRKIAYETALTQQEVDKYLEEFEEAGKAICDLTHNLIFLTKFILHQTTTSPKMLHGLAKLTLSIPSPIIAKAVCVRYPQLFGLQDNPMDTASIPYANGMHTLDIPSAEFGSWKLEIGRGKGEEEDEAGLSAPPTCPHQKIIDAYHEILPELPRMKTWGDNRAENLRTRWRERWTAQKYRTQAEGIEYFRKLFGYVRESDWLMGKKPGRDGRPFFAPLDWIVLPNNFAKLIEGRYHDRTMEAA